jgi:secretion/DNA translocation related CpaE-like protein
MSGAQVVAVMATSGGLGASTLAVALGAHLARRGCRVVVVDTDDWGGGLDVVAGLEDEPGLRWEDLAELEGEVDGAGLVAGLPQAEGVAVLSYAGPRRLHRARREGIEPLWRVCAALRSACDVVVVDTGRSGTIWAQALARSDSVVLLAGAGVRALGAASQVVDALEGRENPPWVCVRSPRNIAELEEIVAGILGARVLGVLGDDDHVQAAVERGALPGQSRGRLAALAARLADELLSSGPRPSSVERLEWATVAVPNPAAPAKRPRLRGPGGGGAPGRQGVA